MSELRELYQATILDHNKKPRNFREPEGANRVAEGHNPLCGDQLTLWLRIEDDRIEDVGFQGQGCAISTASASMLTQAVKGKTVVEALELFDHFQKMATSDPTTPPPADVGKLAVFAGVREFPMRVKCATLAWHTLKAAAGSGGTAKTE